MPFPGVFLAGCHGERQPVRGFGYGAGAVRERAGEVVHAVEIDCCDPSRVRACEFQDASGPVGLPAAGGVGEKDDRGSVHIGHFQRIPVALMVEFDSPYRGDDLDHFFATVSCMDSSRSSKGVNLAGSTHSTDGWKWGMSPVNSLRRRLSGSFTLIQNRFAPCYMASGCDLTSTLSLP